MDSIDENLLKRVKKRRNWWNNPTKRKTHYRNDAIFKKLYRYFFVKCFQIVKLVILFILLYIFSGRVEGKEVEDGRWVLLLLLAQRTVAAADSKY